MQNIMNVRKSPSLYLAVIFVRGQLADSFVGPLDFPFTIPPFVNTQDIENGKTHRQNRCIAT